MERARWRQLSFLLPVHGVRVRLPIQNLPLRWPVPQENPNHDSHALSTRIHQASRRLRGRASLCLAASVALARQHADERAAAAAAADVFTERDGAAELLAGLGG